jgi:hypothetical protein
MLTETTEYQPNAATEGFAAVSPFSESFQLGEQEDGRITVASEAFDPGAGLESPFRSEYLGEATETVPSQEQAAYHTFVSSLYEAEFSETLYELAAEAATALQEYHGELASEAPGEAEQFLERFMAPLGTEAEATFGRLAEQYAQHDISTISENELEQLFESMQPSFGHLSAASENFLGGLWRAATNVGKAIVRGVKAGVKVLGKIVPLGWIFDKLKKLVKPLLKRVLQFAIGKLPASLRPAAEKLAGRLFGETATESEAWMPSPEVEAAASEAELLAHPDLDGVQREFDARLASLFFAPNETEQEALASDYAAEVENETEDRLASLSQARERFVRETTQLERPQDLNAQMENFIPAILAALKIGISIIGRQRVVDFLAKYLAQLVQPYVGRDVAVPLSGAVVSAGMGMIGLEAPERELLAGEAVANVVEGTVRRLAEQGEQIFEDQRLLEAAVHEAFTAAAAESFPPDMIREQFHEVSGRMPVKGTWVLVPQNGRRRYKKYTRILDVSMTRQMANTLESFGCTPLSSFLRSRFGVTPPVAMKAYLYEAVCGTKLSTIARHETNVPGLGPNSARGWRLFIPLTRQTAGVLFGEPELGRDTGTQYVISPRRIAIGQRFVVLVPVGWRPPARPVTPKRPGTDDHHGTRPSETNLTLDLPGSTASLFIFLNETDTQSVARSVRSGESVTPVLLLLRNVYVAALRSMLSGQARRHIKLINETGAEAEAEGGGVLAAVGGKILEKIADKVIGWIGVAISEYFTKRGREFLSAADKPVDGVTIRVTVRHNTLMQALQRALRGDAFAAGIALTKALLAPAQVEIKTFPGFRS